MKNTNESEIKTLLVRIADQLLKDQQELDELAVQFALGKTEVSDRFEKLKTDMKLQLQEYRKRLAHIEIQVPQKVSEQLNHLEASLAKGAAVTKEKFIEQKEQIVNRLEELRVEMDLDGRLEKSAELFTTAAEKAQLQMELFEKQYHDKKIELGEEFRQEMKHARDKIDDLLVQAKDVKEEIGDRMEQFNDEIKIAYAHLKKAFKSL